MIVSQTAEYALRTMAFFACVGGQAPVRAQEVSRGTGIPASYLAKVLRRLVVAGFLSSNKGHGGGFVLARPPEVIRIYDVLMAMDFVVDPDRCVFGWGACGTHDPCPLHPTWAKLKEQVLAWAVTTTLAEVCRDNTTGLAVLTATTQAHAARRPPARGRKGRRRRPATAS